jgi:hypothetical protein
VALLAALAALSACTADYRTTGAVPAARLADRIDSVLVAEPVDGSFQGQSYAGSGHFVAHRAAVEFAEHARRVETAPGDLQERAALLEAARHGNDAYLLIPRITAWELRQKGLPSRVGITMTLVKVASGEEVASTQLDGETSPALMKEGGPNALAIHLVHDYVQQLYP